MEVKNNAKLDLVPAEELADEHSENQVFHYRKKKGFSYIRYQDITTTVTLTATHLLIEESSSLFGAFKPKIKNHELSLQTIHSVTRKQTWDRWDFAFGILFLGAGLVQGWTWWLLSAIFFYASFGGVIQITTLDHKICTIRYSASDVEKNLVAILEFENKLLKE